jgi:hypothetical protein
MDTALKKSVITLNSQFRDHATEPSSSSFTTIPGFLTGQRGSTSIGDQKGQPLFYGVDRLGLLDATFYESSNNSPVSTTTTGIPAVSTVTGIVATTLTNFPDSGVIYVEETGEQILYNSKSTTIDNCIRGFNGTTAAIAGATNLHLVGEPYLYIRLVEPSIGPLEAVEVSTNSAHFNRFFAKIPIDASKQNIQQYINHDAKWSQWSNWTNFSQPFPYIERLRMETFRFYGNTMYPYPNPNDDFTKSLPINITLRIEARENKMWENRGVVIDADEDVTESSGEEEGFF